MLVTTESYTIVYETNNEEGTAPSFFAGVDEEDASYTLGATVVGVAPGSLIAMAILRGGRPGAVRPVRRRGPPTATRRPAILAIPKLDDSGETHLDQRGRRDRHGGPREDLYLNYKEQDLTPGEPIDLEIGPEDGPFRMEPAAYSEG